MKPEYIKNFEKLGFGMFVHFGLFSQRGQGEWIYFHGKEINKGSYFSDEFANKFKPKKDWAIKLVKFAKKSGCKYITLTTKHHEGYCMYDTKGLTTWDSVNHGEHRDFVKEFVDACNKEGIKPFFYHALLDWHHPDYDTNFPSYLMYLRDCVEILCKNYGEIGGLWFDGSWNKPDADWEFDQLYKLIRKYQPNAMIINNTGLSATGEVSHYEIDSVTFERGCPRKLSFKDGKERAGEMCEVLASHWGYCKNDIDFKSFGQILSSLIDCRYCNCNFLLNVGPLPSGYICNRDKEYFNNLGYWIKRNKNFIYNIKSADIESSNCKVFVDDKYYYAVFENVYMSADMNVQGAHAGVWANIPSLKIKGGKYLDNNEKPIISKDKHSILVAPFMYGEALYARVLRWKKD